MNPSSIGGVFAFMAFLVVLSFLLWAKRRKTTVVKQLTKDQMDLMAGRPIEDDEK